MQGNLAFLRLSTPLDFASSLPDHFFSLLGAQGIGSYMRKFTLLFALAALTALSACNTVRGLGQDLESVANAGDEVI